MELPYKPSCPSVGWLVSRSVPFDCIQHLNIIMSVCLSRKLLRWLITFSSLESRFWLHIKGWNGDTEHLKFHYWKCYFSMSPHVSLLVGRRLVGWMIGRLVGLSVAICHNCVKVLNYIYSMLLSEYLFCIIPV